MTPDEPDPQAPELPGMPLGVGGPYLSVAVLCEKVLREADGVSSIIRIVDRITVSAKGKEAPPDMPPVPVNLTAVIGRVDGIPHAAPGGV